MSHSIIFVDIMSMLLNNKLLNNMNAQRYWVFHYIKKIQ